MLTILLALATAAQTAGAGEPPISLHPENPHYFLFRGEPTILVTSGEHYGAVLNLDFDFIPYLDELAARGFNQTRTFSGTYREVPGSFNIRDNTLAPKEGRYQSPWVQTDDGKFDLDRFDPAYFERLRSFIAAAGERGIVVEYVLFCPFYEEILWEVNPMNARNNLSGAGEIPRTEAYATAHNDLLEKQLQFVRRAVGDVRDFDNVYFEVCNEPYFGGVTGEWQDRIIAEIVAAEQDLDAKHLIARNIANDKAVITDPNPAVSLFNFHYAHPDAALDNYGLNKALGDDETGFDGNDDAPYRKEGWKFLLSGGSLYSNLDYSFTPDAEDGSAPVAAPTPGGGGPALRTQLSVMKRFLEGFDFLRMHPDASVVRARPADSRTYALVEPGRQYAVFVDGGAGGELAVDLPEGRYRAEWIDTRSGEVAGAEDLDHGGGRATLESPKYSEDIALRIVSRAG